MSPLFLDLAEVLAIHQDQIERYGGQAGVRDLSLLLSAIAMPAAGMGGRFFHVDLFEMAAAYLFHIVRNHPFVDGNKRVGAMAAFIFLRINGLFLEAPSELFENLVVSVAEGQADKTAAANFFRKNTRR